MAQITKKWIADNAVDETKIELSNEGALQAASAVSGTVPILEVDGSDIVQLLSQTQISTVPTAPTDVANLGSVTSAVAVETSRAVAAETALSTSISNEVSRATAAEASLASAIDGGGTGLASEISRATAAEASLATSIVTETSRATAAEASLAASVSTETDRATAAEGSLSSAVVTETSRATAAEASLSTAIVTETGRATAAESSLSSAIVSAVATETSRATAAEGSLASSIVAEVSRATAAEASLSSSIVDEVSRATAAEASLAASIVTAGGAVAVETTRAMAAEASLAASVSTETGRATTAEASLAASVVAEASRAMTAEALLIPLSQKAAANGVATLDGATKIPVAQLPNAIMIYEGTFDPTSPPASPLLNGDVTAQAGWVYIASVAGSYDFGAGPVVFQVGDFAIYSGSIWEHSPSGDGTVSVNGYQGVVVLSGQDIDLLAPYVAAAGTVAAPDSLQTAVAKLDGNVQGEITRATTAEASLASSVSTETDRATAAEGSLSSSIVAEVSRAMAAEASLAVSVGGGVGAETSRAEAAEASLASSIVAESSRAMAAEATFLTADGSVAVDGDLVPDADNIRSLGAADTVFENVYANSISSSNSSELSLGSNSSIQFFTPGGFVNFNSMPLQGVVDPTNPQDAATKNYVDIETTRATAAESSLASSIVAEVSRATAAEASLATSIVTAGGSVAAETTRATAAEASLAASIVAEVSRATAAETSLSTAIIVENSRAEIAEDGLTSSIANEVSRATAAEGSLSSAVAAEASRAMVAEASLSAAVVAETGRAEGVEATLLPLAGGTMSGTIDMGGNTISNLPVPTAPAQAATKGYVDNAISGLSWKEAAQEATITTLPAYVQAPVLGGADTLTASANGALVIDGITVAINDRVLVKNETGSNAPFNGLYVVTATGAVGAAYVLTRSPDFQTWAAIPGAAVFIEEGTVNNTSSWICTSLPGGTLDTTNITFSQFAGSGTYTAGNGLQLSGTQFSVEVADPSIIATGSGIAVVVDPAGAIITGEGGLTINVDTLDGTTKINGSNQLEALKNIVQFFTLGDDDITNQYVTLANTPYANSVSLTAGGVGQYSSDYTVSGSTVTFAGDLATGGPAALVAGDILVITYSFL